jgi:hyperosmotically inducible protein
MKQGKFVFKTIACIFVIFAFIGCQTTAYLTKKQAAEDKKITGQVEAKLSVQPVLGDYPISVDTYDGDVTLTGQVDTRNQKEQATIIAKSVPGVNQVFNLLKPFGDVEH